MVQAAVITKHVLQMPAYRDAKSIAIFLSMPGKEVSTSRIVLQAFEDGKSVFVPYLHAGGEPKSKVMDMLELRDRDDFQSLKPDAWGIPSLSKDTVNQRNNALGGVGIENVSSQDQKGVPSLDLIFMPAVAFDRSHRRLGHGRGFYDRYLQTYKNAIESSKVQRTMPYLGKLFKSTSTVNGQRLTAITSWACSSAAAASTGREHPRRRHRLESR